MNEMPRHPEASVMAALVDGTLSPDEIAELAGHLRDCRDCRIVVGETARFERHEEASARRGVSWWPAAAAIVAAVAVSIPFFHQRTPIEKLIAASPREHRSIEARLSGFPWARRAAPARGDAPPDPADLKLTGAAGDVLSKTRDAHTTGVADLLIARRSDAAAALEGATQTSNDA